MGQVPALKGRCGGEVAIHGLCSANSGHYAILACATDTGSAVGRAGRRVNATANGRLRWSGGAIRRPFGLPARVPQHAVRCYFQNCMMAERVLYARSGRESLSL